MDDDRDVATEAVEEDHVPDLFKGPILEDPWHRWAAGEEPVREVAVRSVDGDASPNYLLRWAVVEIQAGILPVTRFDREAGDSWDLQFLGRWNATWTGNRLTELSLDCFSEEWPEVVRIVLDSTDPTDLLAAYNGSYPGMWSLKLVAEDNPTENARGEIYGHEVSARDPRLALRIAARYPGIALHTDYFEYESAHETEITSEKGREIKKALEEAIAASASEPMPGLAAAMAETGSMMGVAAIMGQDAEPPPVPFIEPVSASLDSYMAIGTCALDRLDEATLVRAPAEIVAGLAVHMTFPDAVSAIRRADPTDCPSGSTSPPSTAPPRDGHTLPAWHSRCSACSSTMRRMRRKVVRSMPSSRSGETPGLERRRPRSARWRSAPTTPGASRSRRAPSA